MGSTAFRTALKLSYKAATLQKNKQPQETSGSVNIIEIEDKLNNLYKNVKDETGSTETTFNDIISLATSYCNMGIAYKDFTSKTKLVVARSHLKKCLELLNGKELDRRAILIIMRAVVQLEHVFRQLNEAEKCCSFSHKAIGFYLEYTNQGSKFPAPIVSRLSVNLDIEEACPNTMLSLVTLCLQLLRHIKDCDCYKWDLETLVKPMHNFFMYQWTEALEGPSQGFAWAAAILDFSLYFIRHMRLSDARNYLAAIQYILYAYKEETNDCLSSKCCTQDIFDTLAPSYHILKAQLATRWSFYGNYLLFPSKYTLSYSKNVKVRRARKSKSTPSVELPMKSLIFTTLEEHVKDIVNQIPDTVSNLDDVNLVCNYVLKWFEITKNYTNTALSLNESFITRTLCKMEASKYLTYFQADKDKQMTFHKERIELLMMVKNFIPDLLVYSSSDDKNNFDILSLNCNLGLIVTYGNLLDMLLEDAEITEKRFEDIKLEVHNYMKNSVECCETYLEQLHIKL
ncbi:KBP-like protein [Ooceraea biroi]|nr:KBP-like protein [Ooceraea biroi]